MVAEYFDMFGIVLFMILLFGGIRVYQSKDKEASKHGLLIAFLATLGLLVDLYIVIKSFLLGG